MYSNRRPNVLLRSPIHRYVRGSVVALVTFTVVGCGSDDTPVATTATTVDASAIATATAEAMVGDGSLVTPTAAACAAESVTASIGVTRLHELGVRPAGTVDGREIVAFDWTDEERALVHDALLECMDTTAVITKLIVDSAPKSDGDAATCLAAAVLTSPRLTNEVIVAAIEADQAALDEKLSVLAKVCLKPSEVRVVIPPALTTPGSEQVPGEEVG